MATKFLIIAILLFVAAMVCLLIIIVKNRTWRLHAVWELARQGDQLSRLYVALMGMAFIVAVVGQAIRLLG